MLNVPPTYSTWGLVASFCLAVSAPLLLGRYAALAALGVIDHPEKRTGRCPACLWALAATAANVALMWTIWSGRMPAAAAAGFTLLAVTACVDGASGRLPHELGLAGIAALAAATIAQARGVLSPEMVLLGGQLAAVAGIAFAAAYVGERVRLGAVQLAALILGGAITWSWLDSSFRGELTELAPRTLPTLFEPAMLAGAVLLIWFAAVFAMSHVWSRRWQVGGGDPLFLAVGAWVCGLGQTFLHGFLLTMIWQTAAAAVAILALPVKRALGQDTHRIEFGPYALVALLIVILLDTGNWIRLDLLPIFK